MPLRRQVLDVPLTLGLDQKTDVRDIQPQGAVQMTNCVRLKNGAVRKRFGHTAIAKTGLTSAAVNGGDYRGSMWLHSGTEIATYSEQRGAWNQLARGSVSQALDRIGLAGTNGQILDYDVAVGNGYLIYIFQDNNFNELSSFIGLLYGVIDISGTGGPNLHQPAGAVVVPPTGVLAPGSISSVTAPKLIVCGTTAICTWQQNGAVGIRVSKLDLTNVTGGWSAPSTLVTPGGTAVLGVYDIAPVVGDATRFAALYEVAAGSGTVALNIFSVSTLASGTIKNFDTNANLNTCASVALVARNNAHYWIAYVATAGASIAGGAPQLRVAFWNENGNVQAAPITDATLASTDPVGKMGLDANEANGCAMFYSTGYAPGTTAMQSSNLYTSRLTDNSGAVNNVGTSSTVTRSTLGSRPVLFGSLCEVDLFIPSALQGTHFLSRKDISNLPFVVGWSIDTVFAPRLTKNPPQPMASGGSYTLAHMVQIPNWNNGNVWAVPIIVSTAAFHGSLELALFDVAPRGAFQADTLGTEMVLTGGVPETFDGAYLGEYGFINYPELPTPTDNGAGNLSAGTYQYIAHYETRDMAGNVIRSATSPAVSIVLAASHQARLVLPVPLMTNRVPLQWQQPFATGVLPDMPIYVALYRTTANGTLFYRVTPDPPTSSWQWQLAGNPIIVNDNLSDANLTASATAQLIYTTGGLLDNFNPPSARCRCVHMQRVFLSGCDDPRSVWPSKALTVGEQPGFNEQMNFLATGAVRALQTMDDKLVIFVQRGSQYGIEYITGQGPFDTGQQSDWTPPQQIRSDSGAIDQRGTCAGPFGVLYRSLVGGPNASGGIFVLSPDLQVSYVSKQVEDTLNANPVVTSMVVHPNAGRVYVTCVPTDYGFTSGVRLVWDYLQGGVWSTDQIFDADTSQTSAGAASGFIANTPNAGLTYHWVTAAGRVYRETNGTGASSYLDGSQWVTMTYQSSWLKPTLSGFARFWNLFALGDSLEAHDFTMTLTYDYAPSSYYSEAHTWTAPQIATFDRAPQVNVQMTPGNQKAEAIQVTLSDATPTGGGATTGQGPSWAGFVLELAVKEGAYRDVPPAQRA